MLLEHGGRAQASRTSGLLSTGFVKVEKPPSFDGSPN